MKLPNGDRAIVDIRKLKDYCLSPHHPRGRNKARVIASVGIRESNAEELRTILLEQARSSEAQDGEPSPYGQRYIVDFDLALQNRTIRIRSAWIVLSAEGFPRLTSCFVL